MQWALELSDYLISLDLFTDEVKDLRIEALFMKAQDLLIPIKEIIS